jgi:hypothetical protein
MTEWGARREEGAQALLERAVRIPCLDLEGEQSFHENIERITTAIEGKADLLADPDVPVTDAYEHELDEASANFEHRLQQLAGESYDDVANAYLEGERDDWVGALATYYRECYYRLQERYTVHDQIFFLLVLRYPDCVTVNIGFAEGSVGDQGVRYESVRHDHTDLDDRHRERYYAECQYSQREAAEYLRDQLDCVTEAFPDPDTTPREERTTGGFVHVTGRNGSVFSEYLGSTTPDLDRFDDPPNKPGLVPEGPTAKQAKDELLDDAEFVA